MQSRKSISTALTLCGGKSTFFCSHPETAECTFRRRGQSRASSAEDLKGKALGERLTWKEAEKHFLLFPLSGCAMYNLNLEVNNRNSARGRKPPEQATQAPLYSFEPYCAFGDADSAVPDLPLFLLLSVSKRQLQTSLLLPGNALCGSQKTRVELPQPCLLHPLFAFWVLLSASQANSLQLLL